MRERRDCCLFTLGAKYSLPALPVYRKLQGNSMRLVYIALEYCAADLFSGNGICSRSQVRRLANKSEVHVICGRPNNAGVADVEHANIKISPIPLSTWFTTDRNSSYEAFACGVAKVLEEIQWECVGACLVVDWTGMNAMRALSQNALSAIREAKVPVMYLSFRVYMSMSGISEADREFYRNAEGNAVKLAVSTGGGVVALCDGDYRTLKAFSRDAEAVRVIFPMLRSEFSAVAERDRGKILDFGRKRLYLVSLVRLSEDKGAHRFVDLLHDLQSSDPAFWDRTGVIPLICGAASQPEYADRVKKNLKDTVPHAVIVDRFLSPEEMAELLQNAVLNVHPALYEAYGLTIVEAAAMGCPSVVNSTGIGAAQFLQPTEGAVEAVEMSDRTLFAKRVKWLLEDDASRVQLACRAYTKAICWNEQKYVEKLEEFTESRMQANRSDKLLAPKLS